MNIAIIGGGLSGTLTAIHLLRNATGGTVIYLIEKDKYKMNRGIAYSSQLSFQPLNVPASAMSLFPDEPDDFFNWLSEHQKLYKNHLRVPVSRTDFIPRAIFGDYLKARLLEAETQVAEGVQLIRVYDEAQEVKRGSDSFLITLSNKNSVGADKVVLAFGNFLPAPVPILNETFYRSATCIASPWDGNNLTSLPAKSPVLLIGSSLTMVDIVGSLQKQGHEGRIYVVSRHGLLPQPFDVNTKPYPVLSLPQKNAQSISELFAFIRNEIKKAEAEGYTWRSVLDALRDSIPAIWQAFPFAEKERFLRHVRPFWETHRHRMPIGSADILELLQVKGQLEVIAASVIDMQEKENIAHVTIKRRDRVNTEVIQVSRVINCTGPQCNYSKVEVPLVKQMLADGLIKPDTLRLGLVTTPDGMLIGKDEDPVFGLFTLGPPRKAGLYESTALREIRKQALELAHELLHDSSTPIRATQVAC